MCEAGNRVVFDEEESYVENMETGERTILTKERGAYVLTVWVPRKGKQEVQKNGNKGKKS